MMVRTRSPTSCRPYAYAHLSHLCQQFVGAVYYGRDDFSRHEHLVSSDGARHKDIVYGSNTKQVVGVHYDSVLCNAFPYGDVAGLLPVHIGKRRLRACSVGMHYITIFRVAAQYVGYNLAECLREDTFVNVLYGVVHIFFRCAYATHHISVRFVHCYI